MWFAVANVAQKVGQRRLGAICALPVLRQQPRKADPLLQRLGVILRHPQMTNFACKTGGTAKQLTVDQDATTNAAFNINQQGHTVAGVSSSIGYADGKGVGVVFHHHRHVRRQYLPCQGGHVDVAPAHQGRQADHSGAVHLRRGGNADTLAPGQTLGRHRLHCQMQGARQRQFDPGCAAIERLLPRPRHPPGKVQFHRADMFDANFNAQKADGIGHQFQQDARSPSFARAVLGVILDLVHQPLGQQILDDVARRRPVQAQHPRQIRPA